MYEQNSNNKRRNQRSKSTKNNDNNKLNKTDYWFIIPVELHAYIFSFLSLDELKKITLICKKFHEIANTKNILEQIIKNTLLNENSLYYRVAKDQLSRAKEKIKKDKLKRNNNINTQSKRNKNIQLETKEKLYEFFEKTNNINESKMLVKHLQAGYDIEKQDPRRTALKVRFFDSSGKTTYTYCIFMLLFLIISLTLTYLFIKNKINIFDFIIGFLLFPTLIACFTCSNYCINKRNSNKHENKLKQHDEHSPLLDVNNTFFSNKDIGSITNDKEEKKHLNSCST